MRSPVHRGGRLYVTPAPTDLITQIPLLAHQSGSADTGEVSTPDCSAGHPGAHPRRSPKSTSSCEPCVTLSTSVRRANPVRPLSILNSID